jgi:hypothetical protein
MSDKIEISQVSNIEIDGINWNCGEETYTDIYFSRADIGGVDLTDDELKQLTIDFPDELYEAARDMKL